MKEKQLRKTACQGQTVSRVKSLFVYYESIKRELKIRGIYECLETRLISHVNFSFFSPSKNITLVEERDRGPFCCEQFVFYPHDREG